ncbi:MAG: sensor histidine kinase [Streptosporangiaceae bacterium]
MSDQGENWLSYTLRGVRDSALRAPKEPTRTLLWPESLWPRVLVVLLSFALGIGFTAGSIALHINLFDAHITLSWLLGIMQSLPLVVAARYPLVAWRIIVAGMLWGCLALGGKDLFMPWPVPSLLALILVVFAVATSHHRRVSIGATVITIVTLVGAALVVNHVYPWFGIILVGLIVLAFVFGDAVGGRYSAEMSLAEQSELRRQDLARQAVLEERSRIARELHDVVAHHMSVIALQAEAAPYKIPDLPEPAKETFALLREEARRALIETRRVVGLLREEDETAERDPQPGLERLDELISAHEGLATVLRVTGMPKPMPEGVDLSAYRIVQEALSNASRYAPGANVSVEVHYGAEVLRISVRDNGAHGEPEASGGGHGLVGMRERVTMLGGSLFTGRQGEGWAVLAELPYDGA